MLHVYQGRHIPRHTPGTGQGKTELGEEGTVLAVGLFAGNCLDMHRLPASASATHLCVLPAVTCDGNTDDGSWEAKGFKNKSTVAQSMYLCSCKSTFRAVVSYPQVILRSLAPLLSTARVLQLGKLRQAVGAAVTVPKRLIPACQSKGMNARPVL